MFKKILSKITNTVSLKKVFAAVALTAIAVPTLALAYGPERPTYDFNKYDASDVTCRAPSNDFGRCGSMDGPVFNSFINVPGYGDERNFALASEAVAGDTNPVDNDYSDDITTEAGKEYWVRVYVHNNANSQTNTEDLDSDGFLDGVARNTRVRLSFVNGLANAHDLKATVTADNAATVWDEAVLRNESAQFAVQYVAGSALILNASQPNVLRSLSDDVAGPNGTQIGYDIADGELEGCFEFTTRVYVKVRVVAPTIRVEKVAYRSGTQEVLDGQTVSPDTPITYKVRYFNEGSEVANDLTIRDRLPAGVTFTSQTLKWYTNNQNGVVQGTNEEDVFFNQGGINFGNYAPLTAEDKANDLDNGLLTYRVTIGDDATVCRIDNSIFARATGVDEVSDTSTVFIDRNGDEPGLGCEVTELPNTGAGDIVGLLAMVTIGGAVAHRAVLSRFNRG